MPTSTEQPTAFWLASYPRSGNTLARITISQALLPSSEQDYIDRNFPSLDIDQPIPDQRDRKPIRGNVLVPLHPENGVTFLGRHGRMRFVKTHWRSPDIMDLLPSIGGAYFLRHPIDVFLSGLNYLYIKSGEVEAFRSYFINKEPKSVSDIVRDGDLNHYLEDFEFNEGFWPMQFGSGTWVESVRLWTAAANSRNILVLPYPYLVESRAETLVAIMSAAGLDVTDEQVLNGVIGGQQATRPDGRFFWRGGEDAKSQIPPERIAQLEKAFFGRVGIENIPSYMKL